MHQAEIKLTLLGQTRVSDTIVKPLISIEQSGFKNHEHFLATLMICYFDQAQEYVKKEGVDKTSVAYLTHLAIVQTLERISS